MRTIYFSPNVTDSDVERLLLSGDDTRSEWLESIEEVLSFFGTPGSIDGDVFSCYALTDDEGKYYTRVEFVVTTVWEEDDLWISGNEFRLNITQYFAGIRKRVKQYDQNKLNPQSNVSARRKGLK